MFAQLMTRSFCETIYVQLKGSFNEWEVDVQCHGTLDAPDESVGYRPLPEIDGLQVTGARIEGEEVYSESVLEGMDKYVNHLFWRGEIPEGEWETMIFEQMD
jgi:hypothetical protein